MAASEIWKIAGGVVIGLSIFTAVDRLYATWEYNRAMKAMFDSLPSYSPPKLVPTPLASDERCEYGFVIRHHMLPSGKDYRIFAMDGAGKPRTCH